MATPSFKRLTGPMRAALFVTTTAAAAAAIAVPLSMHFKATNVSFITSVYSPDSTPGTATEQQNVVATGSYYWLSSEFPVSYEPPKPGYTLASGPEYFVNGASGQNLPAGAALTRASLLALKEGAVFDEVYRFAASNGAVTSDGLPMAYERRVSYTVGIGSATSKDMASDLPYSNVSLPVQKPSMTADQTARYGPWEDVRTIIVNAADHTQIGALPTDLGTEELKRVLGQKPSGTELAFVFRAKAKDGFSADLIKAYLGTIGKATITPRSSFDLLGAQELDLAQTAFGSLPNEAVFVAARAPVAVWHGPWVLDGYYVSKDSADKIANYDTVVPSRDLYAKYTSAVVDPNHQGDPDVAYVAYKTKPAPELSNAVAPDTREIFWGSTTLPTPTPPVQTNPGYTAYADPTYKVSALPFVPGSNSPREFNFENGFVGLTKPALPVVGEPVTAASLPTVVAFTKIAVTYTAHNKLSPNDPQTDRTYTFTYEVQQAQITAEFKWTDGTPIVRTDSLPVTINNYARDAKNPNVVYQTPFADLQNSPDLIQELAPVPQYLMPWRTKGFYKTAAPDPANAVLMDETEYNRLTPGGEFFVAYYSQADYNHLYSENALVYAYLRFKIVSKT